MASFILINGKPLMHIPEDLFGNQMVDNKLVSHHKRNHEIMEKYIMEWFKREGPSGKPLYIPDEEGGAYCNKEFSARLIVDTTVFRVMGTCDINLYTGGSEIYRVMPKAWSKRPKPSSDLPF